MKLGIFYLVVGIGVPLYVIISIAMGEVRLEAVLIGKLIVGGFAAIWCITNGLARIRRARAPIIPEATEHKETME